jgi:co-chaperonin GroES (HSP10)
MKLTGNKILFKPYPSPEFSLAGLFIPLNAREVNNKGTIVAVGPKVKGLKEGDVVFRVKDWSEDSLIIEGETHYIMDDKAILAKS